MKKPFYITTTLPYINSSPHLGTAMEMIRADVIARYKRYIGYDVFFNTGTDEHGQKIFENAINSNMTPQEFANKNADIFKDFHKLFNISYDAFIRTTDDKHIRSAQKMWNICLQNGDIYKNKQKIKYCVGCEMEKTDSELNADGKCPDHPNRDLLIMEEENYFFRFSKYQDALLNLYDKGLVRPDFRNNEIRKFVSSGLHDFSVSRLKNKMSWGVPVPNDDDHVMYVWFDALVSYIATLDWADNGVNFDKYWIQNSDCKREVVQVCGKDNNKSQSAIWQAMLLSAGIKNTEIININGHIISNGVKMSKSIGNIVNPFDILEEYKYRDLIIEDKESNNNKTQYFGTVFAEEVLRFVLCHDVSTFDDSDITKESIRESYKTYLQNGIGNQLSRIIKLTSQYLEHNDIVQIVKDNNNVLNDDFILLMNEFKLNEAIHIVTDKSKKLDEYIQSTSPFKLVKYNTDLNEKQNQDNLNHAKDILRNCVKELLSISLHLSFFMPRTANIIEQTIISNTPLEKGIFNRVD